MQYYGTMNDRENNTDTQTQDKEPQFSEETSSTLLDDNSVDTADSVDKPPTIFVMHASVGSGHRSAALAIAQALEILKDAENEDLLQGISIPPDATIEVIDILDHGRVKVDGDKTASMFTGFTRPVYDLTWRFTLTGRLLWGGGTIWSHVMFPRFTDYVKDKKPLAAICTHITAANVAVGARMLSGHDFPVISVPTDYEAEGFWPHKESDLFCVANEFMAESLRPRKVPDKNILITGIPTRDDFRKHHDCIKTRIEYGIPEDKLTVLVLAGAYLPRPYIHFRDTVDKVMSYFHSFPNMHFVFIAGNDKDYADHLRKECDELELDNATVLEYVDDMAALMSASDIALCKSGGLTVTECLCTQVPMILIGHAYGQEKANVRMLTSVGAAMHITTARELREALRHISKHPRSVEAMLINADIMRYPDAALDIARASLRLTEQCKAGSLSARKKRLVRFYWGKKPAHIR